ncbi:serine/Arginine-related protein 53-like [Ischnura elegans]|uniref:serine/Arginine-related protein 53-like n=1 Tax=Ischnura elegans TaxID=197161 RepID=UPI001ED8B9A8|nr:serine/Arginine-related protein 53-like [Ischnura elegans]
MSKYSSDSDSSGDDSYHRRKKDSGRSKRRSRSSSESSSSGSRHSTARKRSRKKRKCKSRRSRSRDRKAKSSRSRRNRSGDDRSRSSFRSKSWSRSRSNSKSRSTSPSSSKRSRGYRRSPSSGSQDSHNRSDLKGNASRVPSSREAGSGVGRGSEDQLSAKLQAAMRAAQTADQLLRQQGVLLPPPQAPTSTAASTKTINKNINVSEHTDPGALEEINAPEFVQRNFVSNGRVETSSEQAADIISSVVSSTLSAKSDIYSAEKDSLFHPNLLVNSQVKMDKWVKKLFTLRQKAINGEPLV